MKNYLGLIFLLFAVTATAQNNRSALLPMPNHIGASAMVNLLA